MFQETNKAETPNGFSFYSFSIREAKEKMQVRKRGVKAVSYFSAIWPMNLSRFGKAKFNKGKSLRRDKLVDELTIHGLPLALKAHSWPARLFWAALFVGAFYMLINQLLNIYESITSTPTVINLQQQMMAKLDLPEVTVCSTQSFNATKLLADGISLNIGEFVGSADNDVNRNVTQEEADIIERRRQQIFRKVNTWKDFLDIYGVQCSEFFVKCQIDWQVFDCCTFFKTLYSMEEGVCFRYVNRYAPCSMLSALYV